MPEGRSRNRNKQETLSKVHGRDYSLLCFLTFMIARLCILILLLSVSCSSGNGRKEAERAEYALQHTQELYDRNALPDNDSLIMVAVGWYEKNGPERELALSYYYCGYIHYVCGMGDRAAEFYSKALVHAEKCGDGAALSMICNAIGYMYKHQNDNEEALAMFSRSADLLDSMGRYRSSFVPRYNEIEMLNLLERYDEALEQVNKASEIAEAVGDTSAILELAGMKAAIIVNDTAKQASVHEVIEDLSGIYAEYNAGKIPESHYGTVGILSFLDGDSRSARRYMTEGAAYSPDYLKVVLEHYLSLLEERAGNPYEALAHERKASELKDTLYEENKTSLIQAAERKYEHEYLQKSYDLLQSKHLYQVSALVMIILLSAGIFMAIFIFYRHKLKQQKKHTEEVMAYIDTIRSEYDEVNEKYESLREKFSKQSGVGEKMSKLLGKRMDSLRGLLEIASRYESRPALFYAKFKESVKVNSQYNRQWEDEIISITNLSYGNVIEELRSAHPDLTVHELCYCCFVCLGFSPQSIRVLYDHTNLNSIYTVRSKIRSKLGLVNSNKSLDSYFEDLLSSKGGSFVDMM